MKRLKSNTAAPPSDTQLNSALFGGRGGRNQNAEQDWPCPQNENSSALHVVRGGEGEAMTTSQSGLEVRSHREGGLVGVVADGRTGEEAHRVFGAGQNAIRDFVRTRGPV